MSGDECVNEQVEVVVLVPLFSTCTTVKQEGDGREHQQIELQAERLEVNK